MMGDTFVYNRAFRILITSFLTLLLFCNGILPSSLYCAEASQSRDNSSSTGPNIPFGKDLTNYNPSTDGYFAYLPVRYEIPHEYTEITNQDQETTNSYIPILCYQNTIYIETGVLEEITELFCDVDGESIKITWFFNTRRLSMDVGSASSTYEEGFLSTLQEPLVKLEISSLGAPIRMEDDIYIPMDTVFRMFGMAPTVFESFYWFKQPQVNAIDVLARLYDSADKDTEFSGKQYFLLPSDSASAALGATIADNYYGLATFDPDTWKMAFANFFDDEAINKMYYKQIAQDLLSMDSETSEHLNAMAMNGLDISLSATAQAIGADADSIDIPGLISALESAPRFMPENELSKLITQLKKAQYIQNGIEKLNKYDLAGIGVDGLFAMINNLNVYIDADRIANDGLDTILSNTYANNVALTDGERSVLSKEHENYPKERWISGIVAYQESCDDMTISMAQAFLDTFYTGGVLGPTSLALKITNFVADGVGMRTVDDAEEYMKAFFAPFLIYRFGKGLYFSQRTRSAASLNDKYLREQISLAYLYLRTCRLEDEYIINSGNYDSQSVSTCQGHINTLDKLLAVLARDYVEDGELLPDTAFDRRATLSDSKRLGTLYSLTVPLYFSVYGKVLEKTGDDTPVPDAKCFITCDGKAVGTFTVTDDGSFIINVPVLRPESGSFNISDVETFTVSFDFVSTTADGAGRVHTTFIPFNVVDLGEVYLSEFNWYTYIKDNILPQTGFASLEPVNRTYESRNRDLYEWKDASNRGVLSAQIVDLDKNGIDECVLYYFDDKYYLYAGSSVSSDEFVSALYVKLLVRDQYGNVKEKEARQIFFDYGAGFCDVVGGLIEIHGQQYVYFECNEYAYYANVYGTIYSFYTYDGTSFHPAFAVGKTAGGSIGFEYSVITYDTNGIFSGESVTQSGQPWYNSDGTYSKHILCVDDLWEERYSGSEEISVEMNSFDPLSAMRIGLESITGTVPDDVNFEDLYNGYAFGDAYPTYRTSDFFTQAFHYNCSGVETNKGGRNMTISIEEKTNLRNIIAYYEF